MLLQAVKEVDVIVESETVHVLVFQVAMAHLIVGNNFYCESAYQGNCLNSRTFFPNDPLWDGQQCNNESTCCTGDGANRSTPP